MKNRQVVAFATKGALLDLPLPGGRSPDGSVRTLVVLFADIVDYFPRTRGLQPADALRLLSPLLDNMILGVRTNGGEVLRCFGDGILAGFVADKDRESACSAALRAARRLREYNLSDGFQSRCGMAIGPAYCGWIGNRFYQELSIVGETVDLAARLEKSADKGEILVCKMMYGLLRTTGEWREHLLRLKGASPRVQAYGWVGTGEPSSSDFSRT